MSSRRKIAFFLFASIFIVSSFLLLGEFNKRFLVAMPDYGGTLTEGIIGRPRFINPVLAKSDADRDMTQLIFSGLLRPTPEGVLTPDLAQSYQISPDGLTYTFILREGLTWHDGTQLTSEDVVFTIEKVQDKSLAIKSPRRASWDDVVVSAPDTRTVVFTLKQPYAPFLENTAMGIIPKHIWQNIPNDEFDVSFYNVEPIGAGPYRLSQIVHDEKKGLPVAYELASFSRYALGRPYISNLTIHFYGNNDELISAYENAVVDQIHTIDPRIAQRLEAKGARVTRTELPRVFAAFFNQSANPALADKAVRQALALTTEKDTIVRNILEGYGKTISSPVPFQIGTSTDPTQRESRDTRMTEAMTLLEKAKWVINPDTSTREKTEAKSKKVIPLAFAIAVPDVPELRAAAEELKRDWEPLGARVEVRVYELSTFSVEVLAPRAYDVLFYGQVIGRNPDLFPYWHSSQRNAPGLNVALYASRPTDKLLEELRRTNDVDARTKVLENINQEIASDVPAVFVYSPYFLYVRGKKVEGGQTGLITTESERFLDVMDWHIESDYVWSALKDRFQRKPN